MSSAPIVFKLHAATDQGLVRHRNEDTLLLYDLQHDVALPPASDEAHTLGERGALFAVLDGMGGAASGDVASKLGADVLRAKMTQSRPTTVAATAEALGRATMDAHAAIRRRAEQDPDCEGMGTTMLAAVLMGPSLVCVHVGDSRAYLFRDNELHALTEDQSLFQELYLAGDLSEEEQAEKIHSNVILQALGVNDRIFPLVFEVELRRGDLLLVCSDGLTDMVPTSQIKELAAAHLADLVVLDTALVDHAKARGGYDNISVVLVHLDGPGLATAEAGAASSDVAPRPLRVSSIPSPRMAAFRDYALLLLVMVAMALLVGLMVWAGG